MRYAIRLGIVLCSVFAALQTAPARAEKRVALVIGNGSYAHIAHLPNVRNDTAAMAALFKAARFDTVDVRHNVGVAELRRALREFAARTADADIAVLFYAGHGIEVGQQNYLIPVDARLVTDFDVDDETVPLDRVLQAMEPAKRLRLAILDACRENPFVRSMRRTLAARSAGRGLGRVEPPMSNTLIAYATKPNAIAEDGKGPNSPFTAALVKHLLTPGLDLRIALGHVRDEVLASTGNKQEPYVTGSLGGGVVSLGGEALKPAAPLPTVPSNDAAAAWAAAKDSTSIVVLEAFRRQYGPSNALYDRLAEGRIKELETQQLSMLNAARDRERYEEQKRQEAAARRKADEEKQAKRAAEEAERRRHAALQAEQERRRGEDERRRAKAAAEQAAKKKADDDARAEAAARKRAEEQAQAGREAEEAAGRQRVVKLNQEQKRKSTKEADGSAGARNEGLTGRAAACVARARARIKSRAGAAAIAVGATDCAYHVGGGSGQIAERAALFRCRSRTSGCRIVPYR